MGGDSLDIVSDMWQEENIDIFLVCLLFGTQSKKYQKLWSGGKKSVLCAVNIAGP